ncbi:hypothetical protein DENSPDRAFT_837414 [Dentipellis sp. KUC8613]|nr:hypothetical protein DENSPDRAFT_837414 [Dentipellis sp. KUC8613]
MPQHSATATAMTSNPAALQTAYTLSLLGEYTHTLDTLPLDLSRHFADLRELDAVLSASMHTITTKVNRLIEMIENNTLPKEERLWLLAEIAEEAQRLKLGGEDKIRVACQAADGLQGHHDHIAALLNRVPNFDTSVLSRKTVYPHVASRSYAPPSMYESGRRRRGALLTANAGNDQPTPAKRKRGARDDESDIVANGRSPRKDRNAESATAQRLKNGSRARKTNRAASPTESVLSVTTSQQPFSAQAAASAPRGNNRNPTNKRARPSAMSPTDGPGKDVLPGLPATSHPSLPSANATFSASSVPPVPGPNWAGPTHAMLEGPGMPVARSVVPPATALVGPGIDGGATTDAGEPGELDGEGDDGKRYCWCNMPSYGEMIACDMPGCEREWFHVGCLQLETPPGDTWYCEACLKKKNKRSARGGKRRSGGGARSGARAATASTTA